jgi:NADPH-dependent 2,4-dienoyl-CoA reductase/sulfur reductase-like enzyme
MKIVIIGCSFGGMSCALRAREEYPDAEIVIYDKQEKISFIGASIVAYLRGKEDALHQNNFMTIEDLFKHGIEVRNSTNVLKIDMKNKKLSFRQDLSHEIEEDDYDKLVLAMGSYPILPTAEDMLVSEKVYFLKFLEDGLELANLANKAKHVVVVGGGIMGVELSRIYHQKGLEVTLLHANEHILDKYLDDEIAEIYEQELREEGIDLSLGTLAVNIEPQGDEVKIFTDGFREITADAVIYTIGFRPNTFLVNGQLELGQSGAIKVNKYMQTSVPDVFAVGDCATTYLNLLDKEVYLPHTSDALRTGVAAAMNLEKLHYEMNPSQGTFFVPISGKSIALTGLTLKTALAAGFKAERVQVDQKLLDGSYAFSAWLVYEAETHRILGFQGKGISEDITSTVSSYANLYSLAIEQKLTVEQMELTDFYFEYGFANPLSIYQNFAAKVRAQEREKRVKWTPASDIK